LPAIFHNNRIEQLPILFASRIDSAWLIDFSHHYDLLWTVRCSMPLRKHRLEIVVVESVTSQSNFSSLVESHILSGGIKGGGAVIENNCISSNKQIQNHFSFISSN